MRLLLRIRYYLVIKYPIDVQNISSDDIMDAHDGDLFMSPKDISDELGESMGMGIKLATFTILILLYYAFTECDDIMRL